MGEWEWCLCEPLVLSVFANRRILGNARNFSGWMARLRAEITGREDDDVKAVHASVAKLCSSLNILPASAAATGILVYTRLAGMRH